MAIVGCTPYTTYIMPQIHVPDDFKTQIHTTPKNIDLSNDHIREVSKQLSDADKKFLRTLLYNYYDNYYGLQMCNRKITANAQFIDFYNELALEG